MKSTIKLLFVFMLMGSFTLIAQAQKKVSQGEIKYKLDMSGIDDPMAAMALKGATMSIAFDKTRTKVDMDMGMMRNITISDTKSNTSVSYMNMMGQKFKTSVSAEDIAKNAEDMKDGGVTRTDETKVIAGYTCTKVLAKSESGSTLEFWVTDKIKSPNLAGTTFADLGGTPLEFESDEGGMKMKFTATKVTAKTFESDFFAPLEGYTEMTEEQMKGMFGGE